MALTIPSDRGLAVLRWVTCFAVVLLLHAFAIARLLEQSELADTPPGSDVVQLDVAIGDPQQQIDPNLATPPQIVEQKSQQLSEPEQKDAEVTLPKPDEQAEQPKPAPPAPPAEAQEAKAPAASPEVVRKWQITVNTRLNQFKRYPPQARARNDEGIAIVEFRLGADGRVIASRIVRSSGSPILDEETLNLLARAQPFPVPPGGARSEDLFLQVPISYGLR